jgi:hypothetical protein
MQARKAVTTITTTITAVLLLAVSLPAAADDYYTATEGSEIGEPTEDQALVCFVRPAFAGKAIRFWAFADQTPIGVTRGKQVTCGLVAGGEYIFWTKAENISALKLEVTTGETYFIKQGVRIGGFKARVKLEALSTEEGQAALSECNKRTELTEEGKTRAAEIAAEKWQNAQSKATATAFPVSKTRGEQVTSPASFTIVLPETLRTQPVWSTTELAEANIDGINLTELSFKHDATSGKETVTLKLSVSALCEPGHDKLIDLRCQFMADDSLVFAKDKEIEVDEDELNKAGVKLKLTREQFDSLFAGSQAQLQLTVEVSDD